MKQQHSLYSPHERYIAALSYVGLLFFIPLFFYKESAFAQFHAKQGFAIFLLEILAILLSLTFVLWWAALILHLLCLIASLIGILRAAQGATTPLFGIARLVTVLNI